MILAPKIKKANDVFRYLEEIFRYLEEICEILIKFDAFSAKIGFDTAENELFNFL
jgi:hypothetical protein